MTNGIARAASIAVLAVIIMVTTRIGIAILSSTDIVLLVWAPAGIALAAVLLFGYWLAIGIAIGIAIALLLGGGSVLAALTISTIDTCEVLAAAYVLQRWWHIHVMLDRVRDVVALVATAFVASLVGASAVSGMMWAATGYFWTDANTTLWLSWWWSHLSGQLIVMPLLLTWATPTPNRLSRSRIVEASALAITLLAVGALVFGPDLEWIPGKARPYLLMPLLIWTGLRFGPRGGALVNFALSAMAITGHAYGVGPFTDFAQLQSFVSISAVTTLALCAAQAERNRAVWRKSAIQDAAPYSIITVDGNGRIFEFNPAATELFGLRECDAIGAPSSQLVPVATRPAFLAAFADLMATGHSKLFGRQLDMHLIRADGSVFPAEIWLARVPIPGEHLFTAYIRDVTIQHEAETALRDSRQNLEENVSARTAELSRTNLELMRSEEMLRDAQALAHLGNFEIDLERETVEWSAELFRIYGRDPDSFEPRYESFAEAAHPEDRERVRATLEAIRTNPQPFMFEKRIVRPDGSVRTLIATAKVFADADNHVTRIAGCCQDVTEWRSAETKVQQSLREKEVLLREIHHRVKNNLQVISSLLNLQVGTVPNDEARSVLVESQSRIQSMALVHQLLYQSSDLARIDFLEYLQNLVQRLVATYRVGVEPIEAHVVGTSVALDIDRAIPCGLIVNELVTNALAHAFPSGRRGRITVSLAHANGRVTLLVQDDGVGIPPRVEIATVQSMGLMIAHILSQQLDGTIELIRNSGTKVRVEFPLTSQSERAA